MKHMVDASPTFTGTKPEVLSPAGDQSRLEAAVRYGADAVYLAGEEFGMRSAPANFSRNALKKAVSFAHDKGKKVYLTCNTLPHNDELARLPAFLEQASATSVDALIVSDLGVLRLCRLHAPDIPVHISTQAGVVNFEAACLFHELGASRVVLARELSLGEIAAIRDKTPTDLELEAFVHGAMCVSFSGRCLLSSYMTGRDPNRGDCAQPCRWAYALMEEKRPGEYFPISEDEQGVHILNSRDMRMIEHIPALLSAGVTSFKIEGRAKSAYYTAVVTNAYRCAVDECLSCTDRENYTVSRWLVEETEKISHRPYSTGFYLGGEPGQEVRNGGYVRNYEFAAVVEGYENGKLILSQRSRFFAGDVLEALEPGKKPFPVAVKAMTDERGEPLEVAPHPGMIVYIPFDRPLPSGIFLRRPSS